MINKLRLILAFLLVGASQCEIFAQNQTDTTSVVVNAEMVSFENPKRYIIGDIVVHGVNFMDTDLLTASTGLMVGDSISIPGGVIAQAINRLWLKGYFSDVRILAEPTTQDSVTLNLHLKERPRIYKWSFEGVKKGEQTDLVESLQLKRGTELSEYMLQKNKNLIKDFYSEKGFLNTEIDVEIKNDSMMDNAVNLLFKVEKKERVRIGEITFQGNEVFPSNRLRRELKDTHAKSWKFWENTKFKADEYETDKINIIDFYNSRGYRNAHVVTDTIYDINEKRLAINITVSEGNKYYLRNISWVGNSVYETEALTRMLGLMSGDTYDKKTMDKRLGIGKESTPDDMSIASLYQNEGYLMSQVLPTEVIIGEDSIDLEIKVSEGKPFTINNVHIRGNMRVDDEVIRRELNTLPGELYDRSLLMRTMRQLSGMQHFNPEAIMPGINPVSNELVDITWELEEQASDKFEVSGGWGADMFVGSVGITLNNLSITDAFKKGAWRPYPQGKTQQLQLRAQSNGTYYKQFSMSFTEPWLGGRKPNSLTVSAHYSDQNNGYSPLSPSTQHFRTTGLALGIGHRMSWPDPYFTVYSELSYQMYDLKDWSSFIMTNGRANIISAKFVIGRNSVDQPIYPRKGSDFSIALTLTPPYSKFNDKDYSDESLTDEERYKWIEYHKWNFKGQWFYPLSANNNLVLMAKAEMGLLGSYDPANVSPFEGFDVGGDGMSGYNVYGVDIVGLRGYENSSVTPRVNSSDYARAYNKYTLELRYPFILQPSSTIYGLIFAEGGNAFSSIVEFDPFLIKRSVGAGIRMYLPIVGMIGIDMAYGFDNDASGTKGGWQPHFIIGMQF